MIKGLNIPPVSLDVGNRCFLNSAGLLGIGNLPEGEYGFFFFFLFHVLSMAQERVLYLQARRNGSQGFAVVLVSHGGLVCN
jgi:hypothetical protein